MVEVLTSSANRRGGPDALATMHVGQLHRRVVAGLPAGSPDDAPLDLLRIALPGLASGLFRALILDAHMLRQLARLFNRYSYCEHHFSYICYIFFIDIL